MELVNEILFQASHLRRQVWSFYISKINITRLWDVTPCGLLPIYQTTKWHVSEDRYINIMI
jgi:hypothetical protein